MSESSTSGGGTTPPYPSPTLHGIGASGRPRTLASPVSDSDGSASQPMRAGTDGANYYASGNSRIALSRAPTPLVPSVMHNSEYMYAMDARDNIRDLSNTNSLSSVAFEDSQKRSYHPIEFMMGEAASVGNLAESLESGRLLRNASASSPTSAVGLLSQGPYSSGQNSFVASTEQAASVMSPLLQRPITYGLGPLETPAFATGPLLPPPSPPLAATSAKAAATAAQPAVLSGSLPSIHSGESGGGFFPDVPTQKQQKQLPRISSKNSIASTATTLDKSPLDPSMTARGATPSRSTAPSLNLSRLPILLPSPNSSVDTHRPATPTPFSDALRGLEGGRASAFPTQRLPNPPDRPLSHLLLDAGLADSRRSTNDTAGGRSSVRSTPTLARLSQPPSPTKASVYQTPLALLASSISSNSDGTERSAESVGTGHRNGATDENSGAPAADPSADVGTPASPPLPERPSPVTSLAAPQERAPVGQQQQQQRQQAPPTPSTPLLTSGTSEPPVSVAPSQPPTLLPPPPPLSTPPLSREKSKAADLAKVKPASPSRSPSISPSTSSGSSSREGRASLTDGKAGTLTHLTPLIQQSDYRKSDVKEIACSGAFTMGDLAAKVVKLRLLRHHLLGRAEPLPPLQASALRAGRVKAAKPQRSSPGVGEGESTVKEAPLPPPPPRAVVVSDFHDTMVVFDNVLLAISFALWGSVAHYNALVKGLLHYCGPDVTRRKTTKTEQSGASAAVPTSASVKGRLNVPFSSVLRYLNHCGVDVLVMSSNRTAASSFCAKRQQVRRRQCRDGEAKMVDGPPTTTPTDGGSAPPAQPQQETEDALVTETGPLRRVLVALSFDSKEGVWCPLTVSRPIRHTAAAWHDYRRRTRQHSRQTQRREQRHAAAAAAVAAEKAAVEAKLKGWQQRMHAFCQVETPAAVAAAEAAAVVVMVEDPANGETTTTDEGGSPLQPKPGTRLPFDGVLYPNLLQTDVGFTVMLKQGMHPLFGIARLRLMVGLPLGVVVFLFGIAFIIYVVKTTSVCFYDLATGQCAVLGSRQLTSGSSSSFGGSGTSSSSSSSDGNAGCFAILEGSALNGFATSLPLRFLFGQPVSPGNCLVVTICCSFAALLTTPLIAYFATRYLALGGVRPCFHYVLQAVQVTFGAVACAFAAYVVFTFHTRRHTVSCVSLKESDATLCSARLRSCGDRYAYTAHTPFTGVHVALVLAIVYLILCVLQWLVSFLPVLPSPAQQDAIPTATPDTYAFRPSLFAPDGPTPQETARLRQVMQPPLRRDLEQHIQLQDRLLTASTTIGEMMQANRAQSLKQMKLNEQRRLRRARPFAGQQRQHAGRRGGNAGGLLPREAKKRRRYLAWSGDAAEENGGDTDSGDESSDSSATAAASAASRDRTAVLAPRLVQRVVEIGAKLRARQQSEETRVREATANPFFATASAASAEETRVAPVQRDVRRASSLRRTPSSLRRVVVVSDGEEAAFAAEGPEDESDNNEDDAASVKRAAVPPSTSHIAKGGLPTFDAAALPSSPTTRPSVEKPSTLRPRASSAHFPPLSPSRPVVSSLTAKSSFVHPRASETRAKTSIQSSHFSQLARPFGAARPPAMAPSVEMEIDHIVARLRVAQQ